MILVWSKPKDFEYDEKGAKLDESICKVRFKFYKRNFVKSINMIIDQKQRNINKLNRMQMQNASNDRTQYMNQRFSLNESYRDNPNNSNLLYFDFQRSSVNNQVNFSLGLNQDVNTFDIKSMKNLNRSRQLNLSRVSKNMK